MELQGITRTVSNLEKSKQFYEGVLGFEPEAFYEPTRWQSYKCQGTAFFAVGEPPGSTDEAAFFVPNVEALWERVKDNVEVVESLGMTPWGSYKFGNYSATLPQVVIDSTFALKYPIRSAFSV